MIEVAIPALFTLPDFMFFLLFSKFTEQTTVIQEADGGSVIIV